MRDFFRFWRLFSSKPAAQSVARPGKRRSLEIEALEDRRLLAANVISGYVYKDANQNGLFDVGEAPLANSTLHLFNSSNVEIGVTTSDANGYYQFTRDGSISTNPVSLTKSVTIPSTQTNFTKTGQVPQFDSSLGTLQSVEVRFNGSITSEIRVENTSTLSSSSITGTVGGTMSLSGPGVNMSLNLSQNAGTATAGVYDGTLDYGGDSGLSFGSKTASGSNSQTASSLSGYIGTGFVTFTTTGTASSTASGGGNLVVSINSTGASTITVIYRYIPDNRLEPGTYVIKQDPQPAGLYDGQESRNGVVLNNSPGIDVISVTVNNNTAPNNNFGELLPPSISGYSYVDTNNNGIKDAGEAGIPGVTINLTGTDDLGNVSKSLLTDANGFYDFLDLRPGTYTVKETQPNGYFDGKDTAGSKGGTVTNDQIANIPLVGGDRSVNNNFGELLGSTLSGFVYVDANNNGIKDADEVGISGAKVTLTGADTNGPVNQVATTDASGAYAFVNLQPGTYALNETQPAGYLDGKDTIGSQGGNTSNDAFTNIVLALGVAGVNNNFGELKVSGLSGHVYVDANNNGVMDSGEAPIAGVSVALTGSDDQGAISKATTTDASGYYQFLNLRPGNYTVTETQPSAYLDGKDAVGTLGGTLANDKISNIALNQALGTDYDFGELVPGSLSGYVYSDKNENGVKDGGDGAIAGVTITLTGNDDLGSVNRTLTTDANGFYQFTNLRPGIYKLNETQPTNYKDNQDNLGSLGGNVSNDQFADIPLAMGAQGLNYNFGEIILGADVGIVKTANLATVLVGGTVTYTLTITNYGENVASQVVVTDVLPTSATYVSAQGPGWSITRAGNTLTATTATLPVGVSSVITITIKAPLFTGVMTNVSTVTATTPDDNPTNNKSTVTTLVINQPGTTFPKTIVPLKTNPGKIWIIGKGIYINSGIGGSSLQTTGNITFVDGLWRTLTGKPAPRTTLNNQVKRLRNGTLTREQLVDNLWNTPAHRTIQANNFYETFFHRAPTASERAAAISMLNTGISEQDFAISLLTSTKYMALHPSSSSLVTGLYQDVLGMIPDLASVLTSSLALDTTPWATFVQQQLNSTDALAGIVDSGFREVLRRVPTASETQIWVTQIQTGQVTSAEFVKILLASDEFFQIAYNASK